MSTRSAIFVSLLIGLLGWGALAALIIRTGPEPVFIALALVSAAIAIAGTTMPIWLRLQQRLTPGLRRPDLVAAAAREGVWTGMFVAALLVLHIFSFLDWVLALVLLVLFAMLEAFLQQRSREASAKPAPVRPPTVRPSPLRATSAPAPRHPATRSSPSTQSRQRNQAPFARTKPEAKASPKAARLRLKRRKR